MKKDIQELVEEFAMMEDWLDKYNYLIELADTLPSFPDAAKNPENIIEGCQSRVWLSMEVDTDGTFRITGDSDAIIVRGIVALLVRALGGEQLKDVAQSDFEFLDTIGLMQNLSQNRRQGLQSMLDRIVEFSETHTQ